MAESKTAEFRFAHQGIVSKLAPDLLRDGQYRYLKNVCSNQEGGLASRTGVKYIGKLDPARPECYHISKLRVYPEIDPLDPGANYSAGKYNYRYLGIKALSGSRDINRTSGSFLGLDTQLVLAAADADESRHWEMSPYAAGETGTPWAFLACPNKMVKDSAGNSQFNPLPPWGIVPAAGVAMATAKTGSMAVSSETSDTPCVVTMADKHGLADLDTVTFAGGVGIPAGTYAVRIGEPDEQFNIINTDYKFRIFNEDGTPVAGPVSYTSGDTVTNIRVRGNLDGGSESSPNGTQAYDWAFTYVELSTNDEGNPTQAMAAGSASLYSYSGDNYASKPLAIHNGTAKVIVWGTAETGISHIRVYRKGGILTDQYRLVATFPNNKGARGVIAFEDNMADADLVYQPMAAFDNNPPVPSTVPTPIVSRIDTGISYGFQDVTLKDATFAKVTKGSLVHILDPLGTEDVVVEIATSSSQFSAYFQYAHASNVTVQVDAIIGQPCHLTATIGESVLVAGDPNNPHILYKSKNGSPQAFPVGVDAAGAVCSIGVGTPSNGIVNVTEFRGQALCMNASTLYEVAVINGSLTSPAQVADKGLVAQSAWCKSETEVWFLSTDGIYSWDGGSFRKRTEAIDPLFHRKIFNGMTPLDYKSAALVKARMAYSRGSFHFSYVDVDGAVRQLVCEPAYNDRWTMFNHSPIDGTYDVTEMFTEPDTQSMLVSCTQAAGALFGIADAVYRSGDYNYTSNWWASDPSAQSGNRGYIKGTGSPVAYDIRLPWFDLGMPSVKKLFEEIWLEVDPQVSNGVYDWPANIEISVLLDYSETPVDSVSISLAAGQRLKDRQLISLLTNIKDSAAPGGPLVSYGREAKAISFRITGNAFPVQTSFYRLIFQYQETGVLTGGGATDWMDLGSKFDKKLYQMTVTFDVENTDRSIVLDTINGVKGKTVNIATQSFTLSNPTTDGAGRAKCTFPITDGTIAKLVRVRPVATVSGTAADNVGAYTTDLFKVQSVEFEKEEFPPDIVSFTPWEDGGYEYDKYCNQVDLEVNTNGKDVAVKAQADGTTVDFSFTVNSTESDRRRNVTIPAGKKGKKWRLYCDPNQDSILNGGGCFQLFSHSFKWQKADPGEVGHTFDWDDLGHPWDKYLKSITVEWDNTGGADVTLQLDTLSGIGGQTLTSDILSSSPIVLSGGRGKREFAMPADTIAKMIRLYPKGSTVPSGYKQWKYVVDKVDYPADLLRSTEWQDATSPDNKNPSWLWTDMDTASVAALVTLQNEAGTVMTVTHTGSTTDRKYNYAIPVDQQGKMWRLLLTAGTNGKTQLFGWGFSRWHPWDAAASDDPPEIVLWTPWTDCGYAYDKIARNLILSLNTGGVACSVALQVDGLGTVQTFTVTSTYSNRAVTLACNSNLIGKQWRLLLTPGYGGRAQLWNWALDAIQEPPAVTYWDSYEQGFGLIGFKFIKQIWAEYACASSVTLSIYRDSGELFLQQTLTAHTYRDVMRFLLPSVGPVTSKYNKSVLYRFTLSAATPFKLYQDASGVEILSLGQDRRKGYLRIPFSQMMKPGV